MKKIIILIAILSLIFVGSAYAENNPMKKLYRGAVNIVSAPLEIPKQARAYHIEGAYKTDHILIWVGSGVMWGMVQGVKRTGSGVWDMMSFPFAKPNDYEPLLKPDYVFQQWPSDPNVFIFRKNN